MASSTRGSRGVVACASRYNGHVSGPCSVGVLTVAALGVLTAAAVAVLECWEAEEPDNRNIIVMQVIYKYGKYSIPYQTVYSAPMHDPIAL